MAKKNKKDKKNNSPQNEVVLNANENQNNSPSNNKKKLYGFDGVKIVEVKTEAEALSPEQLKSLKEKLEK